MRFQLAVGDRTTKCCCCGMDDSRRLSTHVIGFGERSQLGGKASQERNNHMQDMTHHIEGDRVIVALADSSLVAGKIDVDLSIARQKNSQKNNGLRTISTRQTH